MQRITVRLISAVLALALFVSCAVAQSKPAADLLIINANAWTVDKACPKAEAIAVLGDRIVAVGLNSDVAAWHGPRTQVIDGGKEEIPILFLRSKLPEQLEGESCTRGSALKQ